MKATDSQKTGVTVNLTYDELCLLSNALNEVLHALPIIDYTTRLAATEGEAKDLLEKIGALIDQLEAPQS